MTKSKQFGKFDEAVKRILSVPKPELKKREDEWKQQRAKKKRTHS